MRRSSRTHAAKVSFAGCEKGMVISMSEFLANLLDSAMWVVFLLLFHGRSRSKLGTVIGASLAITGLVVNIEVTGYNALYSAYTLPVDLTILCFYTFFFLRNSWYWKLFTVLLYDICIFSCNSFCFTIFTRVFHIVPEELLSAGSGMRWLYLIFTKLLLLGVCIGMLHYKRKLEDLMGKLSLLFIFPVLGIVIISLLMEVFSQFYHVGTKMFHIILLMGTVSLLFVFCGYLLVKAIGEWEQKRQNEKLKRQISMQEQIHEKQYENFRQAGKIQHDLKHQLVVVEQLMTEGNFERAQKYLEQFLMNMNGVEGFEHRENVWKTLISIKENKARAGGIVCHIDVKEKGLRKIDINDFCIILGNLLDNAIEAEEKIEGIREISLVIREENMIYMQVKNRIKRDKNERVIKPYSTKKNMEFHGFGLESVKDILNKYKGRIRIQESEEWLEVDILF